MRIRVLFIGCAAAFTALMSGGGTQAARTVGMEAPAAITIAATAGGGHVDRRLCGDPGGSPAGGTGGDAGGDGGGGSGGDAG